MTQLVSNDQWDNFRNLIRDAHDTFSQDDITWRRATRAVTEFAEDDNIESSVDIELKCLISYNTFRTWPMTRHAGPGELDEENMIAIFNKDYLKDLGFLTVKGFFDYSSDVDLFLHRGLLYRPEGDTFFSQAKSDPLHLVIILRREEVLTEQDRINRT